LNADDWLRYSAFVPVDNSLSPSEARAKSSPVEETSLPTRLQVFSWSSIVFAILQSACTAVIAISGVRVAIGLSALAAAAGIHAPARGFHQDAIRIPMMLLALLGSLLNLLVIWRIRKLRRNPASQWRQKAVPAAKLRGENFQIALSLVTLALLAAEWVTHPIIHRVP